MVRSYEGQRLIQSVLDLNLIDCGEGTSCKSVSMMLTFFKLLHIVTSGSMLMVAAWLRSSALTLIGVVI